MSTATALTFTSVVVIGLMAGLFFAWAVSVIPGLRLVPDHTYAETMQAINRAILNPAFLVPFMVAPLLGGLAALWQRDDTMAAGLLAAAAALYLVGVVGVTAAGNVPLNDHLDTLQLDELSPDRLAVERADYERRWNRRHMVRTAASIVAFGLAVWATLV